MEKSIHSSNSAEISHILGIDFGQSKLGLAMADAETKIAFGYGAVKNDKNLSRELGEIIQKENVTKVVIGVPTHMDRPEAGDEQALGKLLAANAGVAVSYAEEMFTTKQAQDNLKAKGAKNIGQIDDQEAARIILQEWLDRGN